MASYIANSMVNDSISQIKGSFSNQKKPQINWDDFNYPPLLKVIHYDILEVDVDLRLIVRALWLSHILIALYSIINIINNIIQAAVLGSGGIRILYSFMFFFSFNPIQCFLFYRGYKGVAADVFLLTLYKWLQIVMILCWVTFSIVSFLGFNGFTSLSGLFNTSGLVFCGILALFEDLSLLTTAMLSSYALYRIWTLKN